MTTTIAHEFALEEQTVSTNEHEFPFEIETVTEIKEILFEGRGNHCDCA